MFTGIVQDMGSVARLEPRDGDVRIDIDVHALRLEHHALGDSISVSGVCLTVVELRERSFSADVSRETLALTSIANWQVGQAVNLEPALRVGDSLGGHLVSGHIDGIATLLAREPDARSERFRIRAPHALARYIARKGSVALDGVSLTVNDVAGDEFGVNIVPHTQQVTTFGNLRRGAQLNLEIDVIARYAERLLGREE